MYTNLMHVRGVVDISCLWYSVIIGLELKTIWCGPIEASYQTPTVPERLYTLRVFITT
jgi:hypothetical protein